MIGDWGKIFDSLNTVPCWVSLLIRCTITRHRASTSTRWHFAFGTVLSQQWNPCTDCKSAR